VAVDIPLVIGTTRDEAAFFVVGDQRLRDLDDGGLRRWLRRLSPDPDAIDQLISTVTSSRRARGEATAPRDLWVAIASEFIFRVPTRRFAERHAVAAAPGVGTYCYLFTWESPAFGGTLGSCHALDLPFVFGTVHNPAVQAFSGGDEDAFELSAAVRSSWTAFARSGDPRNGGSLENESFGADDSSDPGVPREGSGGGEGRSGRSGSAPWAPWEASRHATTVLGRWPDDDLLSRVVDDPRHEELDATAAVLDAARAPIR
jgi:hypothetical protein